MKNPKYTEQLYAIIFLSLGCAFIIASLFCFSGILKPTSHAMIQSNRINGIVFFVRGIVFCIMKIILTGLVSKKDRSDRELLLNGIPVMGAVEKVYLQKYLQYGKKSPYRVLYTYNYQGHDFHGKSHLLWEKPQVRESDSITVFVNESGESAIQL